MSAETDAEVRARLKQMRDEEIVSFVRDTADRLQALASRLDAIVAADPREEGQDAGTNSA